MSKSKDANRSLLQAEAATVGSLSVPPEMARQDKSEVWAYNPLSVVFLPGGPVWPWRLAANLEAGKRRKSIETIHFEGSICVKL